MHHSQAAGPNREGKSQSARVSGRDSLPFLLNCLWMYLADDLESGIWRGLHAPRLGTFSKSHGILELWKGLELRSPSSDCKSQFVLHQLSLNFTSFLLNMWIWVMQFVFWTIIQSRTLLIMVSRSSMLSSKWNGIWRVHPSSTILINKAYKTSTLSLFSTITAMAISVLPISQDYLEDQIKSSKSLIKCHVLQKCMVVNHQSIIISKGYES